MTWKQFNTALNNWLLRLVMLGFGGIFFAAGVAIFVHACHEPGLEFLVWGAMSLPFMAAGALVLILGIFGRFTPSSTGDSDGESMPSQSAVKGSLKNLSPEGKAEGLVILLGYGWVFFCAVALFKCLRGVFSANAPAMSPSLWCVAFSALPVVWWIHRRSQFYKRWGRCTLQLDAPAGVGKPFSGAVEADTRLTPTQDFHFTLLCEERSGGGGDDGPSWWEQSRVEQVVSRDRMRDNGPHSTIPFAFETLSLGSRPPLPGREDYRWRLVFRTQVEGQSYEESFTGELPVGLNTSPVNATGSGSAAALEEDGTGLNGSPGRILFLVLSMILIGGAFWVELYLVIKSASPGEFLIHNLFCLPFIALGLWLLLLAGRRRGTLLRGNLSDRRPQEDATRRAREIMPVKFHTWAIILLSGCVWLIVCVIFLFKYLPSADRHFNPAYHVPPLTWCAWLVSGVAAVLVIRHCWQWAKNQDEPKGIPSPPRPTRCG